MPRRGNTARAVSQTMQSGSSAGYPQAGNTTRSERAELTRSLVLRSAAECFDASGYLGTALDDITARAGVTKGAIYFHFGSKQSLAQALIDEQGNHWHSVVDEISSRAGSALDHVIQLTYEVTRELRQDVNLRAGVRLAVDPDVDRVDPRAFRDQWVGILERLLRQARRDNSLVAGVSPAATARVITTYFLGAQVQDALTDTNEARKRLDEFWSLALPGLRSG